MNICPPDSPSTPKSWYISPEHAGGYHSAPEEGDYLHEVLEAGYASEGDYHFSASYPCCDALSQEISELSLGPVLASTSADDLEGWNGLTFDIPDWPNSDDDGYWSPPPSPPLVNWSDDELDGPQGPGTPPVPPSHVNLAFLGHLMPNLSEQARNGQFDDLIDQEQPVRKISQALLCGSNVLLKGSSSRGKRCTVRRFIHETAKQGSASPLGAREVFELNIRSVREDEEWLPVWECYLSNALALKDEVLLFIPNVDLLAGYGTENRQALKYLKTCMENGLRVVCTADTRSYAKFFGKTSCAVEELRVSDRSYSDLLELIEERKLQSKIDEGFTEIKGHYDTLADDLGMRIHPSVIDTVCEFVLENLTDDELLDGQLPGHAKQWIERCVAEVQLRRAEHPELYPSGYMMDLDVLFFTYSLWTGVDEHDLGAARTGFHVPDPLGLEERLAKQVVGQDAAVEAVSNAIMNVCAGLRDTRRPVGAFLFLGPTGVGKTELAKAVTRELYGSEQELLRFDMSEYQHDHEVSRLIGAPPGYVGYYEGGQLTEAVKKRPYSVVLLDEIDKAHPDVLTAFLQVFDEGHLTDGQGTTVDFRNCLFIMTCNLFSSEIAERMKEGQTQDEVLRDIEARLASRLRPELYNRMDAVVPFNRITSDVVHVVVPMMLSELAKDLSEANLKLTWSDACVELLGELGYSEDFGLRPLKRLVMHKLRNLIARAKLEGKFDKGDTVFVDAKDGVFEVRKADA